MPRRPVFARVRLAARTAKDSRHLTAARVAAEHLDVSAGRFGREVALVAAAVLLVGVGAAGASSTTPTAGPVPAPVPTAAGSPQAAVAPSITTSRSGRSPDVSVSVRSRPTPEVRPAAPAAPVAAVKRWLPAGTGMWLHEWRRSEGGHASAVVARAQKAGLTHLYVQTGSSKKGWIGQEVLSQLMPAVVGTDLKVIAWDFPKLDDPEGDARRLARAAWWNRPGAPMVSAVAPDVETGAEGTNLRGDRVQRYYTELRKRLPARTAILATVPWPSEKRTTRYPYATTAPFADAFMPMAYWYNRSPSTVTATSMTWLARFGKPVMPVGQGYDGRLDAPYLKPDPAPDKSVARFIFVARQHGAQSVSLWSWQTTGPLQWRELVKAAKTVGPQPASAGAGTTAVLPTAEAQAPDEAGTETETEAEAEERARQQKARQKAPGRKQERQPAH